MYLFIFLEASPLALPALHCPAAPPPSQPHGAHFMELFPYQKGGAEASLDMGCPWIWACGVPGAAGGLFAAFQHHRNGAEDQKGGSRMGGQRA